MYGQELPRGARYSLIGAKGSQPLMVGGYQVKADTNSGF